MKREKILAGLLVSLMVLVLLPGTAAAAGSLRFEWKVLIDDEVTYKPMTRLSGDPAHQFEGRFVLDGEVLTDAEVSGDAHVSISGPEDDHYQIELTEPGSGVITVTVDGVDYTLPVTVYGGAEDEEIEEEEPRPELTWSVQAPFAVSEEQDSVTLTVSEGFAIERAVVIGESEDFAELTYIEEAVEICFPYGYVGGELRVRVYLSDGYSMTASLALKNALPGLVFQKSDGTILKELTLPRGEAAEGAFWIRLPDGTLAAPETLEVSDLLQYTENEAGLQLTGLEFGEDIVSALYNGRTYTFPIEVDLPILAFYSGKTASIANLIEDYTVEALEDEIYLIARSPIENVMMDEALTPIAGLKQSANGKVVTVALHRLPRDGAYYTITGEVKGVTYQAGITLYDGVTPPPPIEPAAPEAPGTGENTGGNTQTGSGILLPFTDVDAAAWYYKAVCWAYEKGIMQGTAQNAFSPAQTVDRAMLVTILWRMEGCPEVDHPIPFTDVPADTWYTEAVRWAAAMGIVKGTSETTFAPLETLTREQAAVILYRYAGVVGRDPAIGAVDLTRFGDGESVSPYALTAMRWAVYNGYLNGDGRNLLPRSGMERSQLAQLMMNFAK